MNYDGANPYDRRVSKIMVGFIVAHIAVVALVWNGMAQDQTNKRVHAATEIKCDLKLGVFVYEVHLGQLWTQLHKRVQAAFLWFTCSMLMNLVRTVPFEWMRNSLLATNCYTARLHFKYTFGLCNSIIAGNAKCNVCIFHVLLIVHSEMYVNVSECVYVHGKLYIVGINLHLN